MLATRAPARRRRRGDDRQGCRRGAGLVSGPRPWVWAVAGAALAAGAVTWVGLRPGIQALGQPTMLPSIGAELFHLDASPIVRRGSNRALVLRFSGPVEF